MTPGVTIVPLTKALPPALRPTLSRLMADALIRTAASDYYQGLRRSSVDIQHL
jgi:hypothetical protein